MNVTHKEFLLRRKTLEKVRKIAKKRAEIHTITKKNLLIIVVIEVESGPLPDPSIIKMN
jgi:hypothetical protein